VKQIQLSHGGAGEETNTLIQDLFYCYLGNENLFAAEDVAVLEVQSKIAFTTDSFQDLKLHCNVCSLESEQSEVCYQYLHCESTDVSVIDGEEMYLMSLEME